MKPIITSRWDTDAYKLSMGQVFWQRFPEVLARYEFVDRNNMPYPPGFAERLSEEVALVKELPAHPERATYLREKWPFIDSKFLNWYTYDFSHDPSQVHISQENNKLKVVVEGPIAEATHWEIKLLRIISTLYNEMVGRMPKSDWLENAFRRARVFKERNVSWAEFGGRRPFSPDVHWEALASSSHYMKEQGGGGLIGTSWVEYAYQLGMMPIGTQAHEYTSAMGGVFGHEVANKMALQIWIETYGTRLGYVLPDTYTTKKFLEVFVHGYADLFEGSRQDSGDPFEYIHLMLNHYRDVDVDPKNKSIIHSDSLRSEEKIFALNEYLLGQYRRSFGLGGMITNNCGWPAFNIVAKLFGVSPRHVAWIPTIKISDEPGKAVGDPKTIAEVIKTLNIQY